MEVGVGEKSSAADTFAVFLPTRGHLLIGWPNIPAKSTIQGYWAEVAYRSEEHRLWGVSATGGIPRKLAAPLDGLDSPDLGFAEVSPSIY